MWNLFRKAEEIFRKNQEPQHIPAGTHRENDYADHEGYEVYDQFHEKLATVYYGDGGIKDQNSYIYKYMSKKFPDLNSSELIVKYNSKNEKYDDDIKKQFENDVRRFKFFKKCLIYYLH